VLADCGLKWDVRNFWNFSYVFDECKREREKKRKKKERKKNKKKKIIWHFTYIAAFITQPQNTVSFSILCNLCTHGKIWWYKWMYEVWQFNSWNSRSVSLGCWVRQTRVLRHIWTWFNLCLHEPQTKQVIHSRAAEEVVRVCDIWLAEKWVKESGAADKHQVLCEDW